MTDQASPTTVGALLAGGVALLSAIVMGVYNLKTSKTQIEVARINAEKDIFLQQEKARNEANQKEVLDKIEKLSEVHMTVSKMAKEYSLTRSHFDWTDMVDRTDFRNKYKEDCNEINKSIAVIDIYLAEYENYRLEIRNNLSEIYGNMNCFWGDQEGLLRSHEIEDVKHRKAHQDARLEGVITASNKISEHTINIQRKIVKVVALVREGQDVQHG